MITLKIHNVSDYLLGGFLILCPPLFDFSKIHAARDVFQVLGATLIGTSLLTDYYFSVKRLIPVGIHMIIDVTLGFVLMLAPSVFNYQAELGGMQKTLHFAIGILQVILVIFTRARTKLSRRDWLDFEEPKKAA